MESDGGNQRPAQGPSNAEFVAAFERLAVTIEQEIAGFPPDMHEELRRHAQDVLRIELMQMWRDHQRRQAMLS